MKKVELILKGRKKILMKLFKKILIIICTVFLAVHIFLICCLSYHHKQYTVTRNRIYLHAWIFYGNIYKHIPLHSKGLMLKHIQDF